jgi:hypothetical protein
MKCTRQRHSFAMCIHCTHSKERSLPCVFVVHMAKKCLCRVYLQYTRQRNVFAMCIFLYARQTKSRKGTVDVALILCRVFVQIHTAKPHRRNGSVTCGRLGHVSTSLPCVFLCRVPYYFFAVCNSLSCVFCCVCRVLCIYRVFLAWLPWSPLRRVLFDRPTWQRSSLPCSAAWDARQRFRYTAKLCFPVVGHIIAWSE